MDKFKIIIFAIFIFSLNLFSDNIDIMNKGFSFKELPIKLCRWIIWNWV